MTSSISSFCSQPNNAVRGWKVFLLLLVRRFSSSLIYSFPHKGGKSVFPASPLRAPHPNEKTAPSRIIIRWAKCVCSGEIRKEVEYIISNLIWIASVSSHAHLVRSVFSVDNEDEQRRIFLRQKKRKTFPPGKEEKKRFLKFLQLHLLWRKIK